MRFTYAVKGIDCQRVQYQKKREMSLIGTEHGIGLQETGTMMLSVYRLNLSLP